MALIGFVMLAQTLCLSPDVCAAAPTPPDEVAEELSVATPPEPTYGLWDLVAQCESNERWTANTGNSYYGGLQEDMVFWRRYGGLVYAPRPDLAPRWAQIAVAERGLGVQGWGAWPVCSRRLGLR